MKKTPLFRRQEGTEFTPVNEFESDKSAAKNLNEFTFQDMLLNVGDKLQVKLPANIVHSATESEFYTAELIGYVNNLTIIIRPSQSAQ